MPTPWLDNRHAVFAEVVEGMDVVMAIRQGDRMTKVEVLRIGEEAQQYDLQQVASRKLSEMKRLSGQQLKKLPEPTAPIDPTRIPQPGRTPAERAGLRFFLIHFEGARAPIFPLIYNKQQALEVARKGFPACRA